MKKLCVILFLLTGLAGVYGCQSLKPFIQSPGIQFNNLKIKGMSLFEATAVFDFDVTNPNPLGGTLNNMTYDLVVNQQSIAHGIADKGVYIPAQGKGSVELPVAFNYSNMFDAVSDLMTRNEIAYDLTGTFDLLGFTLPYHTGGKLPLPKLPGLQVKNITVKNLSWTGASLDITLELENNNAFNVTMDRLQYDISLGEKSFISGSTQNSTLIPENGKATLTIPVNANFIWLGKSAYDLLESDSTTYDVTGEMIFNVPGIGEKHFPFDKSGDIPLNRSDP